MGQNHSSEVVLKNTAEAVIIPLKQGISSLNKVYEALIKADVDAVTGQCSNCEYIRKKIAQAHEKLKQSEYKATSQLKNLDKILERLIQDEGKLECKMNETKQMLDKLRKKQESNETLLISSRESLEQARRSLDSTKQVLQEQETRRHNAQIVTGVGVGLLVIPIIGWIAGPAMIAGGAIEMNNAAQAIEVAEEEVRKSDYEVNRYKYKVSKYKSKISKITHNIARKDDKLKRTREEIQRVRRQQPSVADFQNKVRSAVHVLGVLCGRASVAEHQTRRFILQEPVMKVIEDVMKATNAITGNELLNNRDMLRLIDQMKQNNQRLTVICASENMAGDYY